MYIVIARKESLKFQRGEIVSIHKADSPAEKKASQLNKQVDHGGYDREAFIAIEADNTLNKGDICIELVSTWEKQDHDKQCLQLMIELIQYEADGSNMASDILAFKLDRLEIELEELQQQFEGRAREQIAAWESQRQEAAQQSARLYEKQQSIEEIRDNPCFSVPAVRGIQAGSEYYLAQIPYPILARLFVFDEEDSVPAELRAQRQLNKKRAEAISDYMLENSGDYVLPALTASVDKDMGFEAIEEGSRLGTLHIPMSATMLINDGQHRRLAIELALKSDPAFKNETAPVQIHFDQGLRRSQQIFADINSKAVKPSSAINALYDHRNPYNSWVQDLLQELPEIRRRIDFENASVSKKSYKLWSLVAIKKFVTHLTGLSEKTISQYSPDQLDGFKEIVCRFFQECELHIPNWASMIDGNISPAELREQFVIGHAVFLEALGMYARYALVANGAKMDWSCIAALSGIDTHKSSPGWQGRCVLHGRMQKTTVGVKSTAAQLLKIAGQELPAGLIGLDKEILAA